MAGEMLASITYEATSGLPKDRCVNTFAFDGIGAPDSSHFTAIQAALNDWLIGNDSNGNSISNHLSGALSHTLPPVLRIWDVSGNLNATPIADGGVPSGSPIHQANLSNLEAVLAGPLPSEVAVCVTLRAALYDSQPVERADGADPGSAVDRPRSRYSGRNYLGPLNLNAMEGTTEPTVKATFITCIGEAYNRLRDSTGAASCPLAVWSRKDGVMRAVSHVQIDNALDTQRRRGRAATSRTTIAL